MTTAHRPVLVLGASGRLGHLLRAVWPSVRPVRWHARRGTPDKVSTCDILSDSDALQALMNGVGAVVCLAGVTETAAKRTGASYQDNSRLAVACVQAAQNTGCPRVLLMSSAAVYGRAAGIVDEKSPANAVSPYGQSKLDMEAAAYRAAKAGGTEISCLRLGNVAGADAALGGWSPGAEMDSFPSGLTPQRSYIGIESLARILIALADAESVPQVLNVAAPDMVAMGDLLDAAGLAWASRPAPSTAIAQVHLDVAMLAKIYRFAPTETTPDAMVAQWRKAVAGCTAVSL